MSQLRAHKPAAEANYDCHQQIAYNEENTYLHFPQQLHLNYSLWQIIPCSA